MAQKGTVKRHGMFMKVVSILSHGSRRKRNCCYREKSTAAKSQTEIRHDLRGFQEAITPPNAAQMNPQRRNCCIRHTIISMDNKIPSIWTLLACIDVFPARSQEDFPQYLEGGGRAHHQICYSKFVSRESRMEADLDELWIMNVQRGKIIKVYHDIIVQNQLDGFIMPPYQSTLSPTTYMFASYTSLANF